MRPAALLLRALGLGDALTGVAALRGWRRLLPDHRLVLACPRPIGSWLTDLGVVDGVLATSGLGRPLSWPGPPPDLAVNLHGRGPQSHLLLERTRARRSLGFACERAKFAAGPPWLEQVHEVERWCSLVRSYGGTCSADDLRLPLPDGRRRGDYVLMHPGAGFPARRWPADRWRDVAAAQHLPVHVTGGSRDRALGRRIADGLPHVHDLTGRLDLAGLADQVGGARVVLSSDTGVAHLATAVRTRSVTIFGPSSPQVWGPLLDLERHDVIWHQEVPSPRQPNALTLDPRIAAVSVAEMLAATTRMIE
ncbi:glycosyltransferase family 9 protein [Flexivirga sp. ID2601S]|uniref:Glycosyltransferase family 9 protein n=1 Tax=Flexivirga aerilata TaxID=1656889 RepID=A0A849AP01_9MICO|nr:glycosyltransferase family 9 protein [Flexivirga aerilata]NNG41048.1 glycosyltransferase family 9 protein [Flexivirga aerilata]